MSERSDGMQDGSADGEAHGAGEAGGEAEAGDAAGAAGGPDGAGRPVAGDDRPDDDTPGHIDEVAAPAGELDPEAELEQLRDRHLRLAAEFDNFRRRTRQELLETGERARAELARELLEVLDDLQRVADTPNESTTVEALDQGVELVARKLRKTLADAGMEPVDPAGERFDPNWHEALFIAPTGDPEQDEMVSQVVLVGYRLGDRLLRPARVGVYRFDDEEAEEDDR